MDFSGDFKKLDYKIIVAKKEITIHKEKLTSDQYGQQRKFVNGIRSTQIKRLHCLKFDVSSERD